MKSKLSIQGISKSFFDEKERETKALTDVSVEVREKEFVVIVGPSGCGKTTLLKIVAGLLKPTEGKVLLNKRLVEGPSMSKGLVFQHPASFPWLTVTENVEFGLKLQNVNKEKRKNIANSLIDLVGLNGFEDSYLNRLSGGMKQRVAIATVLANNPEILLMDEPFSALDAQTRALMQELVLNVWEETKKTVLFVTHDIEEAIFLADRVYVMGSKPGEIKDSIKIDLSRPRTPEIKLSEDFLRIKKHISYIIRGEAIKAAQVKIEAIRPDALKVGLHTWPGNTLFYLAEELGFYKKNKLEVELLNKEKEEDRVKALVNGEIDLLNLTADAAILAKEKIPSLKIFLCLNKSAGGDAIISRKEIKKIEKLKNKTIAMEKDWVSHFFLLYVLDKFGMKEKDVKIVFMKGSDIGAALISEKVDAAVLWEPWLTQAKKLSGANLLISTKTEPVIFDVLVTTKETAFKKHEKIKSFVNAWFDSLNYIKKNPITANRLMSIPLGISSKELEEQFKTLEFIDLNRNKVLLGEKNRKGKLITILDKISRVWIKNNIIKVKLKDEELIDNSFI